MSQFRVEKRRVGAELTLTSGARRRGDFFLAAAHASQAGPERVADLLNASSGSGFVPFDTARPTTPETVLVNRAHIVYVRLTEASNEPQLDAGYEFATERRVEMLLSNGERLRGAVRVFCPQGRDRLSDYARSTETFRYLEAPDAIFVVNAGHIVELREERVPPIDDLFRGMCAAGASDLHLSSGMPPLASAVVMYRRTVLTFKPSCAAIRLRATPPSHSRRTSLTSSIVTSR